MLDQIDASTCRSDSFWSIITPGIQEINRVEISGLLAWSPAGPWSVHSLTKTHIICQLADETLECNIQWKTLELNENRCDSFSFLIKGAETSQVFYCSNKEDFEKWTSELKPKSIMKSPLESSLHFISRIGKGKFGTVSSGILHENKQHVAIKTIKKSVILSSEHKVNGVATEINALRTLRHKNLVELVGIYESEDSIHILTELCQGGNLLKYLKPRLPECSIARIASNLLSALYYMKLKGWVHLDIKLENILVQDNIDNIKLGDFGFAYDFNSREKLPFRGTIGFVAPEVIEHEAYDFKADMFSLGAVIYTLLSGVPPFDGKDSEEKADSNRLAHVKFPQCYWEDRSSMAKDFVRKCLRKFPENRLSVEDAIRHDWIVSNSEAGYIEPVIVPLSIIDCKLYDMSEGARTPSTAHNSPTFELEQSF